MNNDFELIMDEIITAIKDAGYDPRQQIYDYIQSGKLQYITRHNDAREKIALLKTADVWQYVKTMQTDENRS